jgi:hypothetical protein
MICDFAPDSREEEQGDEEREIVLESGQWGHSQGLNQVLNY